MAATDRTSAHRLTLLNLGAFAQDAASGPRKKVLFFTKSSGFQHSVITRPADDPNKLAYAEQILTDLAAKNGFDVTCSKDGTLFAPGKFDQFDLFVFYTTGDLTQPSDKYGKKKGADCRCRTCKHFASHPETESPSSLIILPVVTCTPS